MIPNKGHYNIQVNNYYKYQTIIPTKGIAGFMFTNMGDCVALVHGMLINPDPRNVIDPTQTFRGDSVSIMLHKGDVYEGTIDLEFRVPIGTRPNVEMVQIYYVDEY